MGVNFKQNSSAGASSAKLRQLSDEVGRIATALDRMSHAPEAADLAEKGEPSSGRQQGNVSAKTVKEVIRARRSRAEFFDSALFADPAWDILLTLYHAELAQLRVPVTSLCASAEVPSTTALRWISTMTDAQLLTRRPDPMDGRRVFVELTPQASEAMNRYFVSLGKALAQ